MPVTLNKKRLTEAANAVALLDKDMACILANHGTPALWAREPGFITLLRIILEQLTGTPSRLLNGIAKPDRGETPLLQLLIGCL